MLEAKNLSFRYSQNSREILNDFSLKVESDDRVAIIAPSGIGKTTLCKILAGYENADSGEVLLDGKALSKYSGYCPIQMIFQHPEQVVNPKFKMGDILHEGGMVDDRIINSLHIQKEWLSRYPSELSGGELQRFCIARALSGNIRFLIADEISTMLDLITQSQIWEFLLEEIKSREIGLIMVSHSTELVDLICNKSVEFPL